jgi:peptidoglycan/LPS O-acetylase OafA/YrhL
MKIQNASFTSRHIAGIDGLRAVAVLSVIIFHLDPAWLPGGFVGVDVFYVISGFVVAASVAGTKHTTFWQYLSWFYRRRILRIMPPLAFFVVLSVLLSVLFIPMAPFTKYVEPTGISSLFGLSNFLLFAKAGDYFSPTAALNPFTHTWSLAIEEQYYLLFPLFSYFILIKGISRARQFNLALVIGLTLVSLFASIIFTATNQNFTFYMLPTRFWELGIGFLLYSFLSSSGQSALDELKLNWAATPAIGIVSFFSLILCFALADEAAFPFPWAIPVCMASVGLIAITLQPSQLIGRALSSNVATLVGRASYSLYLWHWGVIVLMRWTIGVSTPTAKATAVALTIVMTVVSFLFVERPFRTSKRLRALSNTAFFSTAIAILAVCTVFSYLLYQFKPQIGLFASREEQVWSPYVIPTQATECAVQRHREGRYGGELFSLKPEGCENTVPIIWVIGDSHAGAYLRMLHKVAGQGKYAVRIYTRGGCKLFPYFDPKPIAGCSEFTRGALNDLRQQTRSGDIFFVVGLYTRRYRDVGDAPIIDTAGLDQGSTDNDRLDTKLAIEMLKTNVPSGVKIVLEGPKPLMQSAQFRCADWFNQINEYCTSASLVSKMDIEARSARQYRLLQEVARHVPKTSVWDVKSILCPGPVCSGYQDDKPLYFDTDHLSGYGNDFLLPHFVKWVANGK